MEKKFVREKTIKKKYAAIIISTHEDLMHDEDNKAYVVYKLPHKDLSFIACPDKDGAVEFAARIFSALGVYESTKFHIFFLLSHYFLTFLIDLYRIK